MNYVLANILLSLLPSTRWFGFKRRILRALGIDVGNEASVCAHVRFYGGGKVTIGNATWVGPGVEFHSSVGGDIVLGNRCDVAPGVVFVTGSHEMGDAHRRAGPGVAAPIMIGDGCWIGARAMILGGAKIGSGTMIGAGSLVLPRAWPSNVLLLGSPARAVRSLGES